MWYATNILRQEFVTFVDVKRHLNTATDLYNDW